MNEVPVTWLPLERAALCADLKCAAVFEINGHCPRCGGADFLSIGRLLNRDAETTTCR